MENSENNFTFRFSFRKLNHGNSECSKYLYNLQQQRNTILQKKPQHTNVYELFNEMLHYMENHSYTPSLDSIQNIEKPLYFLGSEFDRRKENLSYFVLLKQGLHNDMALSKRIVYNKYDEMIELLRREIIKPKHRDDCECDVINGGCKRKKMIMEALIILQKNRFRDETVRSNFHTNASERLSKFNRNNDHFEKWFTEKLKMRQSEIHNRKSYLSKEIIVKLPEKIRIERDENIDKILIDIRSLYVMKRKTHKKKKISEIKNEIKEDIIKNDENKTTKKISKKSSREESFLPRIISSHNEPKTTPTVVSKNEIKKPADTSVVDEKKTETLSLPSIENRVKSTTDNSRKSSACKEKNIPSQKICVDVNESNGTKRKFVEVDLGKLHIVQQIVLDHEKAIEKKSSKTRKDEKESRDNAKKSFTMSYSKNGDEWKDYTNAIGQIHEFESKPQAKTSIHVLNEGLPARYIRVFPTSAHDKVKVHEKMLGVEIKDEEKREKEIKKSNDRWSRVRKSPIFKAVTCKLDTPPPKSPISLPEIKSATPDSIVTPTVEESGEGDVFQNDRETTPADQSLKSDQSEEIIHQQPVRKKPIVSFNLEINDAIEDEILTKEQKKQRKKEKERALANRRNSLRLKMEKLRRQSVIEVRRNSENMEDIHEESSDTIIQEKSNEELAFFSKYCMVTDDQHRWYKAIFDDYLEQSKLQSTECISIEDAIEALRIVNKKITRDDELAYMFMVLDALNVKFADTVDYKTFSILAAYSERIIELRDFFALLKEDIDLMKLGTSFSKTKPLYECMLRKHETKIKREDLITAFNAAGIPIVYEKYILNNSHKKEDLDFLDFLLYFPIFVLLHNIFIRTPIL